MAGYIVLGLSIAAPVGPINVEIIKRGLAFGFWPALFVGLGGMSSDLVLMGAMFTGISTVLTWTWVKITLMLLGCIILIQTGWTSLRTDQLKVEERKTERLPSETRMRLGSFMKGFLIAGTNPMNILFWVGIYGSVLSGAFQEENLFHSFLVSSLVFVGIGLWNINLAFTMHFGRFLANPFVLKSINSVASIVLIGFGCKFGYDGLNLIRTYWI
ncbi:LysE family transporter [Halobacillus sp. KCTC 3957]|uniref:LysE family transporter n=1 Tax=Halobacillus yeomjeoni TaxID=311194 RepID=A0A931HVN1_9BACI|nr:LysE family transporter [Halobacillus yeomjeoni]